MALVVPFAATWTVLAEELVAGASVEREDGDLAEDDGGGQETAAQHVGRVVEVEAQQRGADQQHREPGERRQEQGRYPAPSPVDEDDGHERYRSDPTAVAGGEGARTAWSVDERLEEVLGQGARQPGAGNGDQSTDPVSPGQGEHSKGEGRGDYNRAAAQVDHLLRPESFAEPKRSTIAKERIHPLAPTKALSDSVQTHRAAGLPHEGHKSEEGAANGPNGQD